MSDRFYTALLGTVGLMLAAGAASAALPQSFTYQTQARMNFASNPGGAFNVPGSWFFSGENIAINDLNNISFHISVTSGDFHAVWFGGNGAGSVVHQGPNGSFFGQTSLNNSNDVVWERQFASPNGVYRYQNSTGLTALFTNRPLGASGWSSPSVNSLGQVGFRANFSGSGTAFVSSAGEATPPFHVAEAGVDSLSPYSFLFTPSNINSSRQIAGKVRRGGAGQTGETQPDEVRIFNSDGTSILIAQDRDANAASPYARFDNSVALADNGKVAFTASLFPFPGGGRGVFVSDGTTTTTIATTSGGVVSNIEFFAPALNESGLVVFRAFDSASLRAIWVGDGTGLVRVATEHDVLPSDLGPARIDQNDSSPVFGGAPLINESGNVAFNAALTPPGDNQVEWGTGVFVATAVFPPPPCTGDADGDGDRDFGDITSVLGNFNLTGVPFRPGDADGDGDADFGDVTTVLTFFNQPCL